MKFRSFAVVPAAGWSVRMGRPKLLLPFQGRPLIDHVLAAWQDCVTRVAVVARSDDQELAARCSAFRVDLVQPLVPPGDMKASVVLGLQHVGCHYDPQREDCWLLAPADMPRLSAASIQALLDGYDPRRPSILVATYQGRRGHPLLMPWAMARQVEQLPADQGIRDLLGRYAVTEVPSVDPGVMQDVDTPDDYARLVN